MKKIISITILTIATAGVLWFLFASRTAPVPPPSSATTPMQEQESDFTIIAFGDSLTAGYGLPASESYPAQLEAALRGSGYSVSVINAGVSGETTRGNRERATFIRNQNPNIVLLGIGGNDALRFLPLTDTRTNMSETISILQSGENPPTVIVLKMQAPLNAGADYKAAFDALYDELSRTYGVKLVPFITEEVFFNEDYKLDDGIHLNKAGYGDVVKNYLVEPVSTALDTRKATN